MTPEERQLLERVTRMAEQNNKMLRRLYHSMLWGRIMQIAYWLLIIGVAFGAYYVIQPYIGPVYSLLNKVSQVTNLPALPKL